MSESTPIAVFDFDGTVYRKDTMIQFCWFVYKQRPLRLRYAPLQLIAAVLHYIGLIPMLTFKSLFLRYTAGWSEFELKEHVDEFWKSQGDVVFHDNLVEQIKTLQSQNIHCVCISASPVLFIAPACERLGFYDVLGSEIAKQNQFWKFTYNCRGENKVAVLKKKYPNAPIKVVFSDNHDDQALFALAQEAYWVKNGNCVPFTAP